MKTVNISYPKTYKPFFKNRLRYQCLYGSAGSGKSYSACLKIILLTLQNEYSKVLVVRAVFATIKDSVFADLNNIIYEHDLESMFNITESPMKITCKHNGNSIIFRGLDKVDKLKSVSKVSTVFIEEATETGITKDDIEQLDLRLRGDFCGNFQMIFCFNPTNPLSPLRSMFPLLHKSDKKAGKAFESKGEDTFTLRTTYKHNPFVGEAYKQKMNKLLQRGDNFSKIYAEGLWTNTDDPDSLISLDVINSQVNPDAAIDTKATRYMGIDVARFGDDKTCFIILDSEGVLIKRIYYSKQSITNTIGQALVKIKEYNVSFVGVDVIGLGAGVADGLRTYNGFKTYDVNSAENPVDRDDSEMIQFSNLRTQLAFLLKDELLAGNVTFLELDDIEKQELSTIKYEIKSEKKLALLPKSKQKKLLSKSPDFADALQIAVGLRNEMFEEVNLISVF